ETNMTLDQALQEAHEAYIARNPKSQAQNAAAAEVMPGGNTRTVLFNPPFPLIIEKTQGVQVRDIDGHEYIDYLGEYTAGIYGHSHPVIRAALDKALDGGVNYGGPNLMEAELAKAVCERFPAIDLVRFTNSGTEANLMALSAARVYTKRNKLMVFETGYHGGVLYFSTGGGSPVNAPYDFVVAPTYNDIEETRTIIAEHSDDLAAIILEPMLGGGGCIPADHDFLQMLRDETSKRGIVLIFDEVMTSRLAPGGMQEIHNIMPDMTTLGKYVGGGMSFGAFGGNQELMGLYDPRRADALPHAGTFNNNVLTMSAGLAGMTEVYTPEAAIALNARGDQLRERLNTLCQRHEATMQFTGIGSMMTAHMTDAPVRTPQDAAKGNMKLRELLFFDLNESGIWIAPRGMFVLSVPTGDAECDALVDAVETFIERRAEFL
ncbi:MAG: aspartate aminotransferase family protein, partial [Chloroflexota bacterium]